MFFAYKKLLDRTEMRTRDRIGIAFSRYGQFETYPEKFEQELRRAVCERRRTDGFKDNYSIDCGLTV